MHLHYLFLRFLSLVLPLRMWLMHNAAARFYLAVVYFRHFRKKNHKETNKIMFIDSRHSRSVCLRVWHTLGKISRSEEHPGTYTEFKKCFLDQMSFFTVLNFLFEFHPRIACVKEFNEVRCERAIFIFNFLFLFTFFVVVVIWYLFPFSFYFLFTPRGFRKINLWN